MVRRVRARILLIPRNDAGRSLLSIPTSVASCAFKALRAFTVSRCAPVMGRSTSTTSSDIICRCRCRNASLSSLVSACRTLYSANSASLMKDSLYSIRCRRRTSASSGDIALYMFLRNSRRRIKRCSCISSKVSPVVSKSDIYALSRARMSSRYALRAAIGARSMTLSSNASC